ncbi:hypothetical protein C5S35_13790 [Candidatus Methanophagaceae archaeon]|nr:hypothetical protein C5S35_13790 [Methanophagales archaeon]
METKFIVYRDEEYTTSWISHEHADEITSYLKGKQFTVLGAKELRNWMGNVIIDGTKDTVVVFAQDVAPDTVFDDVGANAFIRQYLDFGGRVVWMGDLPFSYRGNRGAETPKKLDNIEIIDDFGANLRGAIRNILSVIPVSVHAPRRTVEITKNGKKWGLKTVWSGMKPIVFDVKIGEFVKPLAKIESLIGISEIRYDRRGARNWLKRFFSERVAGIDIGKGGIGIDLIEKKEENKARLRYFGEYASAWFKNFNKKEQNSGFVRIWDFSPRVITGTMKEELYRVAIYGLKK